MSDLGKINFIKGSLRYKGAPEESVEFTVPLSGKLKELEEYDRNVTINLASVYDSERQKSTLFIPTAKFEFIFENAYTGLTTTPTLPYPPFNNNLYYYNETVYKQQQLLSTITIPWAGFPQYTEFTFIRTDYNTEGYTSSPNAHINMAADKITRYNWCFYLSYAFDSTNDNDLYYEFDSTHSINWRPINGLPYLMNRVSDNGKNVWEVKCPTIHNLSVGEFVLMDFNINGIILFQVYSLGNGYYGSEEKIFNILDVGYPIDGTAFYDGRVGQFKRVTDSNNISESTSEYYIRRHKILTKENDSIVTYSGFEQNAFRTKKKYESLALTPNLKARISTKESSQAYNLSFSPTLDINGLLDNRNRPISQLYFTIINKGYFGYFNLPTANGNGLKEGWEFNITKEPNSWWRVNEQKSDTQIPVGTYNSTIPGFTNRQFFYNTPLTTGDTLNGDLCEWNNMTQNEIVLSEYYQKIAYNKNVFDINTNIDNPYGYYYKPHWGLKIKDFSDYIEEGLKDITADFPNYSYYSQHNDLMYWRDIYTYGFIDSDGNGVDYPFMNNRHYPYSNFTFRLIPEGTNIQLNQNIEDPLTDACE